jgi:hypothetical protein
MPVESGSRGEKIMSRSWKTLAVAAFATTMYVVSANAQNSNDDYGDYYKQHIGIFLDDKYYDKCAFDGKAGHDVDFDFDIVKDYYKVFKIIHAKCKIPFWSYKSIYLKGFKCIYVDKNKHDEDDVVFTYDSSFFFRKGTKHAYLECDFKKKLDDPHKPYDPYKT